MRADVHLKGAHGLVLFAAVLAAEVVVLVADDLERLRLENGALLLALGQVHLQVHVHFHIHLHLEQTGHL